jgi:hypothetical protein
MVMMAEPLASVLEAIRADLGSGIAASAMICSRPSGSNDHAGVVSWSATPARCCSADAMEGWISVS